MSMEIPLYTLKRLTPDVNSINDNFAKGAIFNHI